jgi:uncharacterized protein
MANKTSGTIYPLSALRAMVLHTQRLTTPNKKSPAPTPDNIVDLVMALGYVQIDTLSVVNRAHYVTLWSRFGAYPLDDVDRLVYTVGQRQLYEGWGHAASLIALEHYRYQRWRMGAVGRQWLSDKNNRKLAKQTLERIRAEGALRVADFEYTGPQRGPWYDWKPSKIALEALFSQGDLMVAQRVNFQRVYDVRERVLPEWVDTTPITPDEGRRFCLEQAGLALGVFEPRHLTWYTHMFATPAKPVLKALLADGPFVKIQGETMDGVQTWLVHRDQLPLLQRAADGEIKPGRTTFLAPFDSLFWAGDRDERLWGFNQVLECYKRPQDRVYGYFCFPILHKDQLVGRFDPKLDRQTGVLHLNALYLEPGVKPNDELIADVAAALRDFSAWHGAKDIQIEKSDPATFGKKLKRAL